MQNLITTLFFLVSLSSLAQSDYPAGTVYVKTMSSTQFDKDGDTLVHKFVRSYYDSLKTKIADENTLETSLGEKATSTVVTSSPEKYVLAEINPKGDTVSMIIYLFDKAGNRTHNYQVRNGDTLVFQFRTYDEHGNTLALYTSDFRTGKLELDMVWEYDAQNNEVYSEDNDLYNGGMQRTKYKNEYNEQGELIKVTATRSVNTAKYKVWWITTFSGNSKRTDYFYDQVGYNYGIELRTVSGGYQICEFFESGEIKSLIGFDEKGKMLHSVHVTFEKV
jgi:hypothetical protein